MKRYLVVALTGFRDPEKRRQSTKRRSESRMAQLPPGATREMAVPWSSINQGGNVPNGHLIKDVGKFTLEHVEFEVLLLITVQVLRRGKAWRYKLACRCHGCG